MFDVFCPSQVVEFVKPTDETLAAMSSWLSENDIDAKPITPSGDMLEIKIPVSEANDLSAEFAVFTHVETGKTIIRTLQYSLPAPLTQHVEFFHPTTIFTPPIDSRPKFVAASPARRAALDSDDFPFTCTRAMTPACLQVCHFAFGATISTDLMIRDSTAFPPPPQLRSPTRSASLASLTCVNHPYLLPILYLL
jgi:hypothetical protein